MDKKVYVDGMMCKRCAARVEKALAAVPGVNGAAVNLEEKCAVVTAGDEVTEQALKAAIDGAGYTFVRCE